MTDPEAPRETQEAAEPKTKAPRMTTQLLDVLRALLTDPSTPLYGFQIAHATGLSVGTVYPSLRRLFDAGWVETFMEEAQEAEVEGRPRRRYYKLSGIGEPRARHAVAAAAGRQDRIAGALRPRPNGAAS